MNRIAENPLLAKIKQLSPFIFKVIKYLRATLNKYSLIIYSRKNQSLFRKYIQLSKRTFNHFDREWNRKYSWSSKRFVRYPSAQSRWNQGKRSRNDRIVKHEERYHNDIVLQAARTIAKTGLPFDAFETPEFKEMMGLLNKDYKDGISKKDIESRLP